MLVYLIRVILLLRHAFNSTQKYLSAKHFNYSKILSYIRVMEATKIITADND